MKPIVIIGAAVIVAAVAVALLVLVDANTGIGIATPQSGNDIILAAINHTATVTEYTVDYNITNFIEASGESLEVPGSMTIEHSLSGERVSISMQAQGEDISMNVYRLDDGVYNCQTGLSGAYCQFYNDTLPFQNPVEQAEALLAFAAEGTVNVSSQGSRVVLKPCDSVYIDYDIAKLFAGASLPADAASGITGMTASICFDRETGLPLEYEQTISVEAEVTLFSRIRMTATRLALSAPEIKLPEDAVIY